MEKVLYFKYPFEYKAETEKLKSVLTDNNVEFICYESSGYYPHEFIVRKSGKRWNDLFRLINSVKAARYSFKNTYLEMYNGKLKEVEFICVNNNI